MSTIRKAVAAFVFSFLAALGAAMVDDPDNRVGINESELLTALGVALVAGGGTYAAPPNAPRPRRRV